MGIHKSLIPILEKMDFASRYSSLCNKYSDFDNSLGEYGKDFILEFFKNKGVEILFVKNERFFKIFETINALTVQFNIIPHRGFLQFVWDVKKGEERLDLSWGPWESITRELTMTEVKKPMFSSLEELEEILNEAFFMYEDFKRELKYIIT